MPHTGSTALAGPDAAGSDGAGSDAAPCRGRGRRGSGRRKGRGGAPRPGPFPDQLGQDGQGDLPGGPGAELQPGRRENPPPQGVVDVEGFQDGGAAGFAGHEGNVGDTGPQGRFQGTLFRFSVRGDNQCRVIAAGIGGFAVREFDFEADAGAERFQGLRHRRRAHHHDPGRRNPRLEEDLDRPAAQARVGDLDGAFLRGAGRFSGQHPQQEGFLGGQDLQAVLAHRLLHAVSAHKAVDLSAGQHQGGVPGVGARRMLGADHRGMDERLAAAGEFIGPGGQGSCGGGHQIGGLARPCMAAQTRAGVQGMSICVTPNGARASTTALTIAGGEPTVADSPMPFAPIGWCGEGVTVNPVSQSGTSMAVGIR